MGNTSSSSSSSSCYNFRKVSPNETYRYLIKINEEGVDRVQVQHHVFREILKDNFSAPIKDTLRQGASVLDLGCGPGIWVCEMAADYKYSMFHGVDYLNIFPTQKPVNAQFIKANLLKRLPFKDEDFDYVHLRSLVLAFTPDQWEYMIIKEAVRLLRPNAYIEGLALRDFQMLVIRTKCIEHNLDPSIILKIPNYLQRCNESLKRVYGQELKVAVGKWGGKMGEIQGDLFVRLLREESKIIKRLVKLNAKEYEEFIENFIQELNTHTVYITWHKYWAKKDLHVQSN
ncbi:6742_t:CDS:2 [Ambispora leptoticha]|uniref:6742_t:CDS:1 n=1 Tax=Ambispora leptoticha TaxID=144679 RepID=A0A9N9DL42_9GLOM|nr:6742_t:CDS:2 [Ambispora leptoticha]